MHCVRYAAVVVLALGHSAASGLPETAPGSAALETQDEQIVSRALETERACQADVERLLALRAQAERDRDQARVDEINEMGRRLESWRASELDGAKRRLGAAGRQHLADQIKSERPTRPVATKATRPAPARASGAPASASASASAHGTNAVTAPVDHRAELAAVRTTIDKRCGPAVPQHGAPGAPAGRKVHSISVPLPANCGAKSAKGAGARSGGATSAPKATCGSPCTGK